MKYILIASILLLTACSEEAVYQQQQQAKAQAQTRQPWEDATTTYRCTDEQQKRVESDTLFCKNNTSYFSSYCFGSAIMRNCTPKVTK